MFEKLNKETHRRPWLLSAFFISVFMFLALAIGIASPALAQSRLSSSGSPPPPPATDNCNQYTDIGERLKCKFENVHSKLNDTLTNVDELGLLPPTQLESLKNVHQRAARDRERAGSEGFKGLTKKNNIKCQLKECDPSVYPQCKPIDGNGVCDPGEDCLEVIGDGIGDDVQPCFPLNGRHKEVCVQICDQEAVSADAENFDDQASADWEQTLGDTADNLDLANNMVIQALQRSKALKVIATTQTSYCTNLLFDHLFTYTQLQGIKAGANAAKLAADCCDAGCNQDSLGFNCSAVCVAFRLAENILGAVFDGFDMQDSKETGDTIDAMAGCLEELGVRINGIETKLDEIIKLLNTPQGRRPDFPRKP